MNEGEARKRNNDPTPEEKQSQHDEYEASQQLIFPFEFTHDGPLNQSGNHARWAGRQLPFRLPERIQFWVIKQGYPVAFRHPHCIINVSGFIGLIVVGESNVRGITKFIPNFP